MNSALARRAFLKIAGGVAGALATYSEPIRALQLHGPEDWIEDRGDFLVVRVPAGRVFDSRAELRKPTLFLLGHQAGIDGATVRGFVNVSPWRRGDAGQLIVDCVFDATGMQAPGRQHVVEIAGLREAVMTGCVIGCPRSGWGLRVRPPGPGAYRFAG